MIKTWIVWLALSTAIVWQSNEIWDLYIRKFEEITKQKVIEIIHDDYFFIAEKFEKLEEYNWNACNINNQSTQKLWEKTFTIASYKCNISWGWEVYFHVWQSIWISKQISKTKKCVDVTLYFWNQQWELQVWIWAWITQWNQDFIYWNTSCDEIKQ